MAPCRLIHVHTKCWPHSRTLLKRGWWRFHSRTTLVDATSSLCPINTITWKGLLNVLYCNKQSHFCTRTEQAIAMGPPFSGVFSSPCSIIRSLYGIVIIGHSRVVFLGYYIAFLWALYGSIFMHCMISVSQCMGLFFDSCMGMVFGWFVTYIVF